MNDNFKKDYSIINLFKLFYDSMKARGDFKEYDKMFVSNLSRFIHKDEDK